MNKFAVLALVGAVSAHHSHKQQKMLGFLDQIFVQDKHVCELKEGDRMKWGKYTLTLVQTLYRDFIRGVYQEHNDIVTDECFGEWIHPTMRPVVGTVKKIKEDFWSVDMNEFKSSANIVIDATFRNMDACKFERIGDDFKNWCLENPEECIFKHDIEGRFWGSITQIAAKGFDLFNLAMTDDSCFSDAEQIKEIGVAVNDIGEIASHLFGFDYKWDQSVERKHIRRVDFKNQMHAEIAKIPHHWRDILSGAFPVGYEIFQALKAEFEEFMNSVDETVNQMFQPISMPAFTVD